MKRILFYAAFLAAVFSLGSCEKHEEPLESVGYTHLKTVSVELGTMTRAVSESAVNDATLFVYQHNAKTGESLLYHQVYGTGSTFELDLLFSDQTTYTYDIKAYANMGELASEGGDVLFSGESESGLQLHGQVLGIGEADASAVTVDMSRYVGKVTVSKVAVDWTNDHGLQELKLVSMYLANVPAKVGGEATYNISGEYTSSDRDLFIYKPVDTYIANKTEYSTSASFFGYSCDELALVLKCDLAGETMYYHVPYNPEANSHKAFKLTIRKSGSDTPLGELPEETLDVVMVNFNVIDFEETEEDVDFGQNRNESIITSEWDQAVICGEHVSNNEISLNATTSISGNKITIDNFVFPGSSVEGTITGEQIIIPAGTRLGNYGSLDSDVILTYSETDISCENSFWISSFYEIRSVVLNKLDQAQPNRPVDPEPDPNSTFSGVAIYGLDGVFYTAEAWISSDKTVDDAIGVAVGNGQYAFVIHPTVEFKLKWSSGTHEDLWAYGNGWTTHSEALTDFSGKSNTAAILRAVEDGLIPDAPAAANCVATIFAHNKPGYLLSSGEASLAMQKIYEIYDCLNAIRPIDPNAFFCVKGWTDGLGNEIDFSLYPSAELWTSTQGLPGYAWYWNRANTFDYQPIYGRSIKEEHFVHPVSEL